MTRGCVLACLCVISLMLAFPVQAEVSASIDRGSLNMSETFELRLRVEGAMNAEEPQLAPLQQDFEILSTSRNHRLSLTQGRRESWTEWVVVLLPKRSGSLRIPAITVEDERSAPLDITVGEGRSPGSTATGDVSLELLPEAEEVHVQQQLLVTVRLQHAVNLTSGASLDELEIPGAVVRKLDEANREQVIGGRRFGVFERRYAVFPQKSGELRLPALRFRGSTGGDSWFDRFDPGSRQLRLQSAERTLRVLPPERSDSPWLPARNLSIVETWDRDPDALRAGESATRSLTITADGLTGAQIPPIPDPDLPGVRFYADKPEVSDTAATSGVTGTRVQRVAVIPQQVGNVAFPELRVRWWNTTHQRFEEAVVPARTPRVLPGVASVASPSGVTAAPAPGATDESPRDAAAAPPESADASAVTPDREHPIAWMMATAASLLLAAFFAVQWLRLRGATTRPSAGLARPEETERKAFSRLEQACRSGEASAAHAALLDWGRQAFAASPPASLADLSALIGDGEFRSAIDAMMASRFAAQPRGWDGGALVAVAARHRPAGPGRAKTDAPALPPLYDMRRTIKS